MERKNPASPVEKFPDPRPAPLQVNSWRGSGIETVRNVHALVVDASGKALASWGNIQFPVFPRSSIKVIQALPLILDELHIRWGLDDSHLALLCASHHGEEAHTKLVSSWLEKMDLDESDLECGAHEPYNLARTRAMIRADITPTPLHNNCSGKHTGMLCSCLASGLPTKGYSNYDHPLQERQRKLLQHFYGKNFEGKWGIDGCGIPNYQISLEKLAGAMAKLAVPEGLGAEFSNAIHRLNSAIKKQPYFIGGTDSFCSRIIRETKGEIFAKVGADGVYGAWIPKLGIGLALKCENGDAKSAESALHGILENMGQPLPFPPNRELKRWTGEVVGAISIS